MNSHAYTTQVVWYKLSGTTLNFVKVKYMTELLEIKV